VQSFLQQTNKLKQAKIHNISYEDCIDYYQTDLKLKGIFMTTTKQILLILLAISVIPFNAKAESEKPNIVLIFMDNFGWGEPGFNGGGIIRGAATPRLDQIANQGLKLTNFNVEVQCTPSRSALMTGRYAIRSGNGTVPLNNDVYGLVNWEVTMAEMLSNSGYATGIFGKWHLGRTKGRFPTDQGFDEWFGIPNSSDESVYSSQEGFSESGVKETYVMSSTKGETPNKIRPFRLDYRPFIDKDITDKAIDFIKRKANNKQPFFTFIPYTSTHFPAIPHPDFKGKSGNGQWADMLMQLDYHTGQIVDTIDDLGISENTIIIFTADNGPEAANFGSASLTVETTYHGSPGPWRGTLFTSFEGGLRVPFAMRWPNKIKAGRVSDEIVHAMDLFPTFARLAGGNVPEDRLIDGIDVSDFISGKRKKSGRDGFIVYMGNDIYGVKWKNWKIHLKEQDTAFDEVKNYRFPRVYNLLTDPQERDNVLLSQSWVPKVALNQYVEHKISLKKEQPIRPGTKDPYIPEAVKN
tara:strand:+ start:16611 stop:18176 length:1566 start_codon:yes stop_codon:yes gene_type:complete